MDVELKQGLEVLRCKIFYKVFKESQEMYILVTGLIGPLKSDLNSAKQVRRCVRYRAGPASSLLP